MKYNFYTQVSQSTHEKHKTQNAGHILRITQVLEIFSEQVRERYKTYLLQCITTVFSQIAK